MKTSEFIEKIFGIKLLSYQKHMVDLIDVNKKYYITSSPHRNCVDLRYIRAIMDILYPINKEQLK